MIKYIYATIFLLQSLLSISQKTIELYPEKINIENRKFYVLKVIDKRENKGYIGKYTNNNINYEIYIKNGVLKNFGEYFQRNCTKQNSSQIPVIVYINTVNVSEFIKNKKKYASASITLTFKNNKNKYKTISSEIKEQTNNPFITHEKRIRKALLNCLIKYNNTINQTDNYTYEIVPDEDAIEITFDNKDTAKEEYKKTNDFIKKESNNVKTIGYQIGGINLIGIDYEERITEELGIHAGIGLVGYTFGIKLYTRPKQNNFFVNLSWKDGGFGIINGFGIETGSRWIWDENKNIGLLYQAGVIFFNHIDDTYVIDYLGGIKPSASLIFGIGIYW